MAGSRIDLHKFIKQGREPVNMTGLESLTPVEVENATLADLLDLPVPEERSVLKTENLFDKLNDFQKPKHKIKANADTKALVDSIINHKEQGGVFTRQDYQETKDLKTLVNMVDIVGGMLGDEIEVGLIIDVYNHKVFTNIANELLDYAVEKLVAKSEMNEAEIFAAVDEVDVDKDGKIDEENITDYLIDLFAVSSEPSEAVSKLFAKHDYFSRLKVALDKGVDFTVADDEAVYNAIAELDAMELMSNLQGYFVEANKVNELYASLKAFQQVSPGFGAINQDQYIDIMLANKLGSFIDQDTNSQEFSLADHSRLSNVLRNQGDDYSSVTAAFDFMQFSKEDFNEKHIVQGLFIAKYIEEGYYTFASYNTDDKTYRKVVNKVANVLAPQALDKVKRVLDNVSISDPLTVENYAELRISQELGEFDSLNDIELLSKHWLESMQMLVDKDDARNKHGYDDSALIQDFLSAEVDAVIKDALNKDGEIDTNNMISKLIASHNQPTPIENLVFARHDQYSFASDLIGSYSDGIAFKSDYPDIVESLMTSRASEQHDEAMFAKITKALPGTDSAKYNDMVTELNRFDLDSSGNVTQAEYLNYLIEKQGTVEALIIAPELDAVRNFAKSQVSNSSLIDKLVEDIDGDRVSGDGDFTIKEILENIDTALPKDSDGNLDLAKANIVLDLLNDIYHNENHSSTTLPGDMTVVDMLDLFKELDVDDETDPVLTIDEILEGYQKLRDGELVASRINVVDQIFRASNPVYSEVGKYVQEYAFANDNEFTDANAVDILSAFRNQDIGEEGLSTLLSLENVDLVRFEHFANALYVLDPDLDATMTQEEYTVHLDRFESTFLTFDEYDFSEDGNHDGIDREIFDTVSSILLANEALEHISASPVDKASLDAIIDALKISPVDPVDPITPPLEVIPNLPEELIIEEVDLAFPGIVAIRDLFDSKRVFYEQKEKHFDTLGHSDLVTIIADSGLSLDLDETAAYLERAKEVLPYLSFVREPAPGKESRGTTNSKYIWDRKTYYNFWDDLADDATAISPEIATHVEKIYNKMLDAEQAYLDYAATNKYGSIKLVNDLVNNGFRKEIDNLQKELLLMMRREEPSLEDAQRVTDRPELLLREIDNLALDTDSDGIVSASEILDFKTSVIEASIFYGNAGERNRLKDLKNDINADDTIDLTEKDALLDIIKRSDQAAAGIDGRIASTTNKNFWTKMANESSTTNVDEINTLLLEIAALNQRMLSVYNEFATGTIDSKNGKLMTSATVNSMANHIRDQIYALEKRVFVLHSAF